MKGRIETAADDRRRMNLAQAKREDRKNNRNGVGYKRPPRSK